MPNYLQTIAHSALIQRLEKVLRMFSDVLGKRRLVLMLASSVLVSLIEFAGLALIFPFIKLVTDPPFLHQITGKFDDVEWLAPLLKDQTAILFLGTVMIVFYIVKGLVHAKLIRYQANVAADLNGVSSQQLIRNALYSRYQLFQDHGAVKIAGISYSNTTHLALLFQALVAACNELILLGFVFAGIVLLSPWFSVSVLVLLAFLAFGLFLPLSRRVAKIGQHTQEVDLARHRFVFAMASAIRDIKIMGLELPFIRRNDAVVDTHVKLTADYVTISAVQRIAVEVIMVCSVVIGCIWLGFSGVDIVQLAPLLATVGLVVIRAAPSLSRLAASYNSFRYSLPFVESLQVMQSQMEPYAQSRQRDQANFTGDYLANDINFSYGSSVILKDISIQIPKGKVTAIVGSSGAGKSTLLDLLAGLQLPSSGTFKLDGKFFSPFYSLDFPSQIGYVPQSITLLDASIEFNIALEDNPDYARLLDAVQKAHLTALISSLPNGLSTVLGEGGQGLSGGQRQRIGIARALYRSPALLILDEVTSALDPEIEALVMQDLLSLKGQTTLLIVTHKLDIVGNADLIYRLQDGHLLLQ